MQTLISKSEEETKKIAEKIAKKNSFVCLYGDLGSGKTIFSKGFARGLGLSENQMKSPTYTLVRFYKIQQKKLHHFDFYRIREPDDLMIHDLEEIFSQKNAIILIEWPERIKNLLPEKRLDIYLEYVDKKSRRLTIVNR